MDDGTSFSTSRASLRLGKPICLRQCQPLRCRLSNGASQCMPRRLQDMETSALTKQFTRLDSQTVRQPEKRLPLLVTELCSCHRRSSLNLYFFPRTIQFAQAQTKRTKFRLFLLLTFNSKIDQGAIGRIDPQPIWSRIRRSCLCHFLVIAARRCTRGHSRRP
jgi:hypothetical protein